MELVRTGFRICRSEVPALVEALYEESRERTNALCNRTPFKKEKNVSILFVYSTIVLNLDMFFMGQTGKMWK